MSVEFSRVAIVGVGLMGGSLGLAIKRGYPSIRVSGVDRESKILKRAIERGAIDRGYLTLEEGVSEAQLIFLAAPISAIVDLLPRVAELIAPDTLVTDLGSTKARICRVAQQCLPNNFIGGHPMTGSERQGIEAADSFLFENALYVLTPGPQSTAQAERFRRFLEGLGARVLYMDAEIHDRVVAYVSHLPQLLAVALADLVGRQSQANSHYQQLAAGGFRDMTRIATSPYELWADIIKDNTMKIEQALDELVQQLTAMKTELKRSTLRERFRRAAAFRNAIPRSSKGFLEPLHRIAVSVPDRPGVLARMTTAIAQAEINIKDIELLKVRENVGGTFHLYFESLKDAERAVQALEKAGYPSHRLD